MASSSPAIEPPRFMAWRRKRLDGNPAGGGAAEYETREEADAAMAAHGRATARVYVRREGEWDRVAK